MPVVMQDVVQPLDVPGEVVEHGFHDGNTLTVRWQMPYNDEPFLKPLDVQPSSGLLQWRFGAVSAVPVKLEHLLALRHRLSTEFAEWLCLSLKHGAGR